MVSSNNSRKSNNTTTTVNNKTRKTIAQICFNIFVQNGNKPLYVKRIYGAMRQRRWHTEGVTPTQTIASKLAYDSRFLKVGPNTFRLNKRVYNKVSSSV